MPQYHDDTIWGQGNVADECHVADKPEFSKLLGPNGKPLRYEKFPVGFQPPRRDR